MTKALDDIKIIDFTHVQAGHPERRLIISRVRGYHGTTYGGTSAQGLPLNKQGYGELLADVVQVPSDDIEALSVLMAERSDELAAVITEPVQGAAGVYPPVDGYLAEARRLCDQHGALLIFDEVITGFGRLGEAFAADYFSIVPDMVTMAKGMTNGTVPMSAVCVRKGVYDAFMHGPESTIELFHEVFCRTVQTRLSGALRAMVDVEVVSADQLSYGEFVNSMPTPSFITIVTMEPLEGNAVIEVSLPLVFSIIDRLVGGPGTQRPKPRELTEIEVALVQNVTEVVAGDDAEFGGLRIETVHADHKGFGPPVGGTERSVGYIIHGSQRHYFAGDTALTYDMKLIGEAGGVDVAVLPIGDNFTMGPDDAVMAAQFVQAKRVIPCHYNTWPYIEQNAEAFADKLNQTAEIDCVVMSAGDELVL